MIFSDILYGKIYLPDWIVPFLKMPEFVRLRGVRLSNVDSYEFKDFNAPTRWEHCVGVAYLATICAKKRMLNEIDTIKLILASLLHDIATPPFAHTVEYIFDDYDHELESFNILSNYQNKDLSPSEPIFASQTPQFRNLLKKLSKDIKLNIDGDEIAELLLGGGELGFLINGSVDLDNIDNVSRASLYLGINIDKNVPIKTCEWLSRMGQSPGKNDIIQNEYASKWLSYKNAMYDKFYNSSDEEIGRQAYLQHLIRRAYNEGMSRKSIIWNTDERLLFDIESFKNRYIKNHQKFSSNSLEELVQRYRLLESPEKILEIEINDFETFSIVKNPRFANWLEQFLTTPTFEPFVIINSKRYNNENTLFKSNGGNIKIFSLNNSALKFGQMNDIIRENNPPAKIIKKGEIKKVLNRIINDNIVEKPWLKLDEQRKDNIKSTLDSVGNWSFRQSRNESIHTYPATFVHTIPSTLISSLGLKNEIIYDPFGGTGQTAMEAIKLGCIAYSSDSNTIANLISTVKFTYLNQDDLRLLSNFDFNEIIKDTKNFSVQNFDKIDKWHHPKTIIELSKILSFINTIDNLKIKNFLTLCFSDILTSCTNRKGKEHGYFADNTPLGKNEISPLYSDVKTLITDKIKNNLNYLSKIYANFERLDKDPELELSKATVFKHNIINKNNDYLKPESISGIITSPPYLCMVDYTLGQRLSYEWLFPELIKQDFNEEIAPRRKRFQKINTQQEYYNQMRIFARNCFNLLSSEGFLATVLGAPTANIYRDNNILGTLDQIFFEEGLELFWETTRPINWHRNHGYSRLKDERISVYTKK